MAPRKAAKPKKGGAAVTILPPLEAHSTRPGVGEPGNPGKQPGTTELNTRELRRMILAALKASGGENYLIYHAMVNPQLFFPLIGKVLPLEVAGDPDAPLNVVHHYIQRKSVKAPKKK